MKNIKEKILAKDKLIFIQIILGISCFLCTFLKNDFLLNPYVLILLLLSCNFGNVLSLTINTFLLMLGAYIKSINYGIEISISSLLFISFLFLPRIKKSYFQLYVTNSIFYIIFIIIYSLTNNLSSKIISFIISFLLVQFVTFYIHQKDKKQIYKATFLFLIPGIFIENEIVFKILFFIIVLLNLNTETLEERLSILFIEVIISYIFYLLVQDEIIALVIASLFSLVISKRKYRPLIFTAIYIVLFIIKFPTTFYKSVNLFLPIISLLIYYLVSNDEKIIGEIPSENQLLSKINNMAEYLTLIETNLPDPNIDTTNIKENLKLKQCEKCSKNEECNFIDQLSHNLPSPLEKSNKKNIMTSCSNGSKLIYRYKVISDMVNVELKKNIAEEEKQNAIRTLIEPLKKMCLPINKEKDIIYINNILGKESLVYKDDKKISTTRKLTTNEIKNIENILNKSILGNPKFSLLFQQYTYEFKNYSHRFSFDYSSKKFSEENGDSVSFYQNEQEIEFALFDAMGHSKSSGLYSDFAKKLFEITRSQEKDFFKRIVEINNILLCQSTVENYITADFLIKSEKDNEYLLYKFGSSQTIIVKKDKTRLSFINNLPPLGIINNIKNSPFTFKLEEGDKIFFSTDGIDNLEKIDFSKELDAETYLNKYFEKNAIYDDTTLCILTFKK